MRRAARFKTGSVVFDKRRKTWYFLWWQNGKRRSKLIGTLREFPTKSSAQRAAQPLQKSLDVPKATAEVETINALVARYKSERLPSRKSTARVYSSWLDNYVVPHWGHKAVAAVQPREIELWLKHLQLSQKSKSHVRNMFHLLLEFAMWCGIIELARNPIDLVVVKGASKRIRAPRSLTVEQFRKLFEQLKEPFQDHGNG